MIIVGQTVRADVQRSAEKNGTSRLAFQDHPRSSDIGFGTDTDLSRNQRRRNAILIQKSRMMAVSDGEKSLMIGYVQSFRPITIIGQTDREKC